MPGAFFDVEGLVDGAVDIDHEVDGESAEIVENFETLAAGAANIVMDDELIDGALEEGEVPAAAADALEFIGGEGGRPGVVTVGRVGGFAGFHQGIPCGFFPWGKAFFDAIRIVTTGIRPEDHGCAGVKELTGNHNFIEGTFVGEFAAQGFGCLGYGFVRAATAPHARDEGDSGSEECGSRNCGYARSVVDTSATEGLCGHGV